MRKNKIILLPKTRINNAVLGTSIKPKNKPIIRVPKLNPRQIYERNIELRTNNERQQIENVGVNLEHINFPEIKIEDIITNERIIRISDWVWSNSLSKFNLKSINQFGMSKLCKKGDIICVRTNLLNEFYNSLSKLKDPIILITNYADKTVDNSMKHIADHPKIFHWFAINCLLEHPKVTKIPLGLGASHNAYGNLILFTKMLNNKDQKPSKKILVNYKIDKLRPARVPISSCLLSQGFINYYGQSMENYWKSMINHEFILSPPGCGIDCYRIWETLYLGRIPVVINSPAFDSFKDLPILFVENYDNLFSQLEIPEEWKGKEFKWELLKYSYWFNLINRKKDDCLGIIKETISIPPLIETLEEKFIETDLINNKEINQDNISAKESYLPDKSNVVSDHEFVIKPFNLFDLEIKS